MNAYKITKENQSADVKTADEAAIVRGLHFNTLIDDVSAIETNIDEIETNIDTVEDTIDFSTNGIQIATNVKQYTKSVTVGVANIVGTDAGDLGHTAGVELVAAPGAGYVLQFISAILVYDFGVAAYTGAGSNDLVIRHDTTAVSSAIADADLLLATADKIVQVQALSAADIALVANKNINLKSSAVTQPGTAAGVIDVHITYNVITTGL